MTSETTETAPLADDSPDPTLQWETMGLEDRPIAVARTVTMGTRFEPGEQTPRDLVDRLPNLVDPDGETTLPELEIKGTIGEGGMGRDYFVVNEINRRMLWSVVALFVGATAHRSMSWFMEIPYRSAVTTELLIYGLGTLVMALSLDRRLLGAAIPFGLAALGAMLAPGLVFWIFAGVNVLIVAILCALWWPDEPREELDRITGN